jgi:hypothetical protein
MTDDFSLASISVHVFDPIRLDWTRSIAVRSCFSE